MRRLPVMTGGVNLIHFFVVCPFGHLLHFNVINGNWDRKEKTSNSINPPSSTVKYFKTASAVIRAVLGLDKEPEWLRTAWLLEQFGDTGKKSIANYYKFMCNGDGSV